MQLATGRSAHHRDNGRDASPEHRRRPHTHTHTRVWSRPTHTPHITSSTLHFQLHTLIPQPLCCFSYSLRLAAQPVRDSCSSYEHFTKALCQSTMSAPWVGKRSTPFPLPRWAITPNMLALRQAIWTRSRQTHTQILHLTQHNERRTLLHKENHENSTCKWPTSLSMLSGL